MLFLFVSSLLYYFVNFLNSFFIKNEISKKKIIIKNKNEKYKKRCSKKKKSRVQI
jgi:hypothetical protein